MICDRNGRKSVEKILDEFRDAERRVIAENLDYETEIQKVIEGQNA